MIKMAIKRNPGMTLEEYCVESNSIQITVQHADNDRITHVKGVKRSASYELQEGQTIWVRKNDKLIKEVYKKPSAVQKITSRLKGRR